MDALSTWRWAESSPEYFHQCKSRRPPDPPGHPTFLGRGKIRFFSILNFFFGGGDPQIPPGLFLLLLEITHFPLLIFSWRYSFTSGLYVLNDEVSDE